jgi:hypothetical protein
VSSRSFLLSGKAGEGVELDILVIMFSWHDRASTNACWQLTQLAFCDSPTLQKKLFLLAFLCSSQSRF